MATTLIDPRTGQELQGPDENVEEAKQRFGLVTPEEYARQKQAEAEGPLLAGARNMLAPVVAAGSRIQSALPQSVTGYSPEELAATQEKLKPFYAQTEAAKEAFPVSSFIGGMIPAGVIGAASGGAGEALATAAGASPALGAAAALGTESALTGMSQEAVDAVTQNRDFSWKAAGMLGLTNLAIGGVTHAALGGFGRAGADEAAEGGAGASAPPAAPPGMRRNYLAEVDPGELPEAVGAGRRAGARQAESAGAAAANFDDMTAGQAIGEIREGKVNAGKIAEAAPAIRKQLSLEGARDLDFINDVLDKDTGLAAKKADFAQGAAEWTPDMVERQNAWLGSVTEDTAKAIETIDNLPDAKGVGRAAKEALENGARKLTGIEGADRNVAIDDFKRSLQRQVMKIWSPANSSIDMATREAVAHELQRVAANVRTGLLDEGMFGRNARIQAAHNEPLHEVLDALNRVQKRLYETTGRDYMAGGLERRADPDALRRIFEDPHLGGELFQRDLAHVLDMADTLGRNRLEHGLSRLERLPDFIEKLQNLREDMNTAQVLHAAEEQAGGGAHASTGAALGANALVHAAEFGGRAVGLPLGQVARSTGAMGKVARGLDRAAEALGFNTDMAKPGTATRTVLDRYAARVKGSEILEDPLHRARMPEALSKFLDQAHAPPAPPAVPPGGAPPQGQNGPPSVPPAPPANDIAGKVAGGLALAGGAGALLAPGQANAATLGPDGQTMLPEQAQARAALADKLSRQSPEERAASVATAEALARIGDRTKQRVDRAVSDLFTVAVDPAAPQKFRSPAARAVDQRSADLDVPRAVARFMGNKTDDPVEAWQEKRELLNRVMDDPSSLAQTMAQNLGDLPHQEPEVFTQMVAQTMKTVSYLAEKMPAPTGKSAFDPGGYPPSFEDITTIAGYWVGALHPLDTLDDLAQNDLVPEQIQAVKDLNPDAYTMFQSSAMRQIHALAQSGKTIPLDALQQIDSALQLDGAGEPVLSSKMAALIQTATQQAAQKGAPVNPPSPLQGQGTPIQSKAPARLASSSLGTLHDAQG